MKLIRRLFRRDNLFEMFLSSVSVTWFSIMLAAGDRDAFAILQAYHLMGVLAPNWAWLMIGLLASIAKIAGLVLEDFGLRRFGVAMSGVIWSIVGLSIGVTLPGAMGWSVYACMAAFAFITYVVLGSETPTTRK